MIWLIRHGETALKSRGAYQGWIDESLSESGKTALMPLVTERGMHKGWVYVSPLRRARETASRLFPFARQVVIEDLREMHFGVFEGRTPDEMKTDPDYCAWVNSGCEDRCPGGETKAEFSKRTCSAFSGLIDLAVRRGDEEVFLVAHGGTQMAVMERFVDPEPAYYSWLLDCGEGYQLSADLWQAERRLTVAGVLINGRQDRQADSP